MHSDEKARREDAAAHAPYDPDTPHAEGQTTESDSGAEYEEDKTMSVTLSIAAIALGAGLGANLRWGLGLALNHVLPQMPPGTLVANLLGAFLIGIAIALFTAMPELSSFWRLLIVTGFLGALTTFSTFSSEIYSQLEQGHLAWAFVGIATHVVGSLVMVAIGMATWAGLRQLGGAS